MNFWQRLKKDKGDKPITVLAPMYDVTDVVFREIVEEVARPDVFYTEFVHCEAILSGKADVHVRKLDFLEKQHPIVAQIWGTKPETYMETAKLLVDKGFDGIDINMGCPERAVIKTGACSALIKNPTLASEIIDATIEGAGSLPVSVKTRLGFSKYETESWLPHILNHNIAALIVHGRTVSDMSVPPANWDEIAKAVSLRDTVSPDTVVIGNGDIESMSQAASYKERYKVDGVMIGRGIFKNIRVFAEDEKTFTLKESLNILVKHTKAFEAYYGARGNFNVLKKYYKIYTHGYEKVSTLRERLMNAKTYSDVYAIISSFSGN